MRRIKSLFLFLVIFQLFIFSGSEVYAWSPCDSFDFFQGDDVYDMGDEVFDVFVYFLLGISWLSLFYAVILLVIGFFIFSWRKTLFMQAIWGITFFFIVLFAGIFFGFSESRKASEWLNCTGVKSIVDDASNVIQNWWGSFVDFVVFWENEEEFFIISDQEAYYLEYYRQANDPRQRTQKEDVLGWFWESDEVMDQEDDSERVKLHNVITKAHQHANDGFNERGFYYFSISLGGLYEEVIELTEQQTQSGSFYLTLPFNNDFHRMLYGDSFFLLHTHQKHVIESHFGMGPGVRGAPASIADLIGIITLEEELKDLRDKKTSAIYYGVVDPKALWVYDFSDSALAKRLRKDLIEFQKSIENVGKELGDKPEALEYYINNPGEKFFYDLYSLNRDEIKAIDRYRKSMEEGLAGKIFEAEGRRPYSTQIYVNTLRGVGVDIQEYLIEETNFKEFDFNWR
jgi:hypothetical protein